MKKIEDLIVDIIILLIRFIIGVALGVLFSFVIMSRSFWHDWFWMKWILIVLTLFMGISAAIWGDKVLKKLWEFISAL